MDLKVCSRLLFLITALVSAGSSRAYAETAEGIVRSSSDKQITLEVMDKEDAFKTFLISPETHLENVVSVKSILPGFIAVVEFESEAGVNIATLIRVKPVERRQRDYKIEKLYLNSVSGVIQHLELQSPAFLKLKDHEQITHLVSLDPVETQVYVGKQRGLLTDLKMGQTVDINCVEQEDGLLGAVSIKIRESQIE